MATIQRFEDLNAWKKARELSIAVFNATRQRPFAADYDLVRQIRRASGSGMDNIAEGFGRAGRSEFIHFLSIAKGSVTEVKSQLYRAKDFEYLSDAAFNALYEKADVAAKVIDGLMVYLKGTDIKGRKFASEPEVAYNALPLQVEDSQQ